jgi:hypothetical protein
VAAAVATTVATAIATVAAMATAMAAAALAAATMAATAAARAGAATAVVAAAIAAVARRMAAVAAVATTAAEQAGLRLILTAQEGDSNQREKDRDTQNNNTVHPRILQLLTGTSKRENYPRCLSCASPCRTKRASEMRPYVPCENSHPSIPQPLL